MYLKVAFLSVASARITVERETNVTSAVVSSSGTMSFITEHGNSCGLPTSGQCQASARNCFGYDFFYCPAWEAIVLAGDCILPNAHRVCCDEVPAPCLKEWESAGLGTSFFCSTDSACLRPSCAQEKYYLESQYSEEMKKDDYLGDCFFASSARPSCGSKDAVFGNDNLPKMSDTQASLVQSSVEQALPDATAEDKASLAALLGRADAPALEEQVSMDTTLSEKDDVTTSENNIATSGVVGNEEFVNFAEASTEAAPEPSAEAVPAASAEAVPAAEEQALAEQAASASAQGTACDEKVTRRVKCRFALKNQLLGDDWLSQIGARILRKSCDKCLREGTSEPSCPSSLTAIAAKSSLSFYDKTYCKCML